MRRYPVFLCVLLSGFSLASAGLCQADYFGNQAVISNLSPSGGFPVPSRFPSDITYFHLDDNSSRAGFRFTAQQPAPITEVQLFFPVVTGAPEYQVTLETDSGGLPSGTALSTGAFFAPVTGWNRIAFPESVGVTAGRVYHLVVRWNPASPPLGPSNASYLELSSRPDYFFYPQSGVPDPQLAVEEDPAGGGWAALAEEPVFLVNYSGVWGGNPYSNTWVLGACWEVFTVPSTIVIDSVGTYAAALPDVWGEPFTTTLNWALSTPRTAPVTGRFPFEEDPPTMGATLLGGGVLASPGQLGATFSWVDAPTAPITLVPGTEYVLNLSQEGSPKGGYNLLLESPGIPFGAPDLGLFGEVSFGGTGSFAGNPIAKICGLCATSEKHPAGDIPFRLHLAHKIPTPTPTPYPVCDSFHVSKNIFSPGQEPVSITVDHCQYPGGFSLDVYNSAGEFIVSLDKQWLAAPLHQTYTWDGKNKNGDLCASGIYILCAAEPLGLKKARVLLVR